MDDLTKFENFNLGGGRSLQFCPIDLVSDVPDPLDQEISTAITFGALGRWFSFYTTPETLSFKQTAKNTEDGVHYLQEVGGFLPGQSSENENILREMEAKRHLVLFTDNNGQKILLGWPRGMKFLSDYGSQKKSGSLKGFDFNFIIESICRAPFYTYSTPGGGGGSS